MKIATHAKDEIKNLKRPTNITKLCLVFELRSGFRGYVPNFAPLAAQINNMFKKDHLKHFGTLTAEQLRAMHKLREKLMFPL